MIGISVFLNDPNYEQWERYIYQMNTGGFKGIFTSLHIPEDDPNVYVERLQKLGELAKSYHMDLVADVSPKSLEYLGYSWENAYELIDWGVTGLRVDYGIDDSTIANLSKQMKIALNASTITEENITRIIRQGGNLANMEAWHNYYPRPETGLGLEDFNRKNQWLKTVGLKVMTFIPGEETLRAPLYERLPTLEKHRKTSTFSSFVEFDHNEWVDHIYVGDPGISETSKEQIQQYVHEKVFALRIDVLTKDEEIIKLLDTNHTNRMDAARDVIRSVESRSYASKGTSTIKPLGIDARSKGSITIDNSNYGRYQGELQITKVDLPKDKRVNVIGKIIEEDISILEYMEAGAKFTFLFLD
ncbi:DUF871 domain-containing protein [Oceanobacillus kimchii]|uniref:DUF871 domain-containing protein n=1 Tax=Oceanobacillus kimchii TaxID=746691 RepID=A0ABQ5TH50_9BACI|nr:MupG family TIM beta-alpha barrel fold protein [Oceanobacillus kimchii]GLO64949.1 hypothetical protein MACH08_07330 [Oceanobacillus kimchii]